MLSYNYRNSINYKITSELIIKKLKFLLSKKKLKDIYFNTSQDCLGLKIIEKGYSTIRIIIFNIKNFNMTVKIFSSKIIPYKTKHKKINNLYVTWGTDKNFKKNGEFSDYFLSKNSRKEKNNLFIVFYNGKFLPKKIDKNILIFYQNHHFLISNYFKALGLFFSNLFNLTQTIINFNWQTLYSEKVEEKVFPNIKNFKIKNVYCVYEGHNYQKKILSYLKKKKTKTLARLSTVPSPYPVNFFYKKSDIFIDKFLINSVVQKKIFINYLNWPKKKIIIRTPAKIAKSSFFKRPTLYLSINVVYSDNLLKNFSNFLKNTNKKFYPLAVRPHPSSKYSKKNTILKNKIKDILKNYKNRFNRNAKNKYSFFFGPTGALIEALNSGQKAIQICDHNILDVYNPYIWKNLYVKKISLGVYKYKIKLLENKR